MLFNNLVKIPRVQQAGAGSCQRGRGVHRNDIVVEGRAVEKDVRAFRSVEGWGLHFIASMEPLPVPSGSVLATRLPPAAAADFVEWGPASTAEEQFNKILARERPVEGIIGKDPVVPALEDDQPINEYYLLRYWFHYYK